MRCNKVALFFILFKLFLSPYYIFGETVTYEELIEYAIKNSPRLKIKSYEINIAHANYKKSLSNFYPRFFIGIRVEKFDNLARDNRFTTAGGQVIGGQTDEWRSSVFFTGEYYISNWYKRIYETSYLRLIKESSFYDCLVETKKLIKEITDLYAQVIETKTKLDYSNVILDKLKRIYELKKLLYQKGEISLEELLKTEAEIESILREQANLRRELNIYISSLSQKTGKKLSDGDNIMNIPLKGNIPQFFTNVEDFPEYKFQVKQIEAYKERLKATRVFSLPDIAFYMRYDLYGSDFSDLKRSFDNIRQTAFTFGFFLTMPIFDGGGIYWERIKATYELKREKEKLELVKEEKRKEIENLYINYKELNNILNHYKNLLKYYERMYRIGERAYELGEKSIIELLDMEIEMLKIERDIKVTENTLAAIERKIETEVGKEKENGEEGYYWACMY